MKSEIVIQNNTLIVKNFFKNIISNENPYTEGLYGKIPTDKFKDCYNKNHCCTDLMEWAYNNPYQPTAEIDKIKNIKTPFLDASKANGVKNIGSLKNIWKKFEKKTKILSIDFEDIDINKIEKDFWDYYIQRYKNEFENSVHIFEEYVKQRRSKMTKEQREFEKENVPFFADDNIWRKGCRDFLKHLVYTTPRGYIMELVLFSALSKLTGGIFIESSIEDEKNGIDGYIKINNIKYPICLKPSSFRGGLSPICKQGLVFYKNKRETYPDLIFKFKLNAEILQLIDKSY